MTPAICLVCEVWTVLDWQGGISNAFYHQTAGVQCQNNLQGDTHKYASHTACIFTHSDTWPLKFSLTYALAVTVGVHTDT